MKQLLKTITLATILGMIGGIILFFLVTSFKLAMAIT